MSIYLRLAQDQQTESGVCIDKTAAVALVGLVTTVACFVDRVWSEANEGLGFHQFFNDGRIIDVVDVVDDLRALVAHPTVVFKLRRTMHGLSVDGHEPAADPLSMITRLSDLQAWPIHCR